MGTLDGEKVGECDGTCDGASVGSLDGEKVGETVGAAVVGSEVVSEDGVGKLIVAFFASSALQHSDPIYDDKMLPQVTFTVSNIAAFVISSAQQEFS